MRPEADRDDRRWMREALRLAALGEGWTRPNPPVGAVVVDARGRVAGRGWHQQAGGPHAEVFALAEAGNKARGATLYVTLEPCSTWGRTPPCTEAVIRAGIRRVVAAVADPNPRHAAGGFNLLEKAGIALQHGVLEEAGQELIAPFGKWIRTGIPFVTLKLGLTLDGRIADANGHSKWITGPESRRLVQKLRGRADAVLVGAGTVCADNPSLLPRTKKPNPVYRVAVDGAGIIPPRAAIFTDAQARMTIVATSGKCPARRVREWEKQGATVWRFPSPGTWIRMGALLKRLGKMGLLHVVCEGGGQLAGALLEEGLVDECWWFYAPRLLGGSGIPGIGGPGWSLKKSPALSILNIRRVGADILVRAVPQTRR